MREFIVRQSRLKIACPCTPVQNDIVISGGHTSNSGTYKFDRLFSVKMMCIECTKVLFLQSVI